LPEVLNLDFDPSFVVVLVGVLAWKNKPIASENTIVLKNVQEGCQAESLMALPSDSCDSILSNRLDPESELVWHFAFWF
jgi:hypothetical protein